MKILPDSKWTSRLIPVVFYTIVSLLVLGPLLKSGYIFYLEQTIGPAYHIDFSSPAANGFYLTWLIYPATRLMPAWAAQKILFFLCLFLAGIGMHMAVPVRRNWPRYFAGLLYLFNPFVFVRLQAGHLGFLLAYALAPLVLAYAVKQAEKPTLKRGVAAGLYLAGLTLIDYHSLYLLIPYVMILAISLYFERGENGYTKAFVKSLVAAATSFFTLSLLWIVPALLTRSPVTGIDVNQLTDFATRGDALYGLYLNVAALNGFWQTQLFEAKSAVAWWPYIFMVIFGLAIWGLFRAIGDKRLKPAAIAISMSSITAFVLALGISSPFTEWLYRFLFKHVAAFQGFREPQKFAGLLVLAYAYLGAIGADDLIDRAEKRAGKDLGRICAAATGCLLIALVIVNTYPMLWGLSGRLKTVDFPASWYKADQIMKTDKASGRALFLPRHLYMGFSFNDRQKSIGNPAPVFFSREVVVSENLELLNAPDTPGEPAQERVEELLDKGKRGQSIAGGLKQLNVRYVILARESDWRQYWWIFSQDGFDKVLDKPEIVLFKIG